MASHERAWMILNQVVFALCLGFVPAVLLGAYGFFADPVADRSRLVLLAAIGAGLAVWIQLARLAQRIRESKRRMADPMYRAKLVEFEIAATS